MVRTVMVFRLASRLKCSIVSKINRKPARYSLRAKPDIAIEISNIRLFFISSDGGMIESANLVSRTGQTTKNN